jgi:diacylglycerol kinase (ATP)
MWQRDDILTGSDQKAGATDRLSAVQLIVNPTARQASGQKVMRALDRLRAGGAKVAVLETAKRGDAEAFAREAAQDGQTTTLIAAGGDGTINEIINGMAGLNLPLGILPLGTANVLAAELGIPEDPVKAASVILTGRPDRIYLGSCNDRYFVMMAGIGFDARVVEAVQPGLKRRLGKAAYVWESLRELTRHRPNPYRLSIDGGPELKVGSAIVANGHYYGGRFVVSPDARLDEPELEVALFERGGRIDALRYTTAMVLGFLTSLPDFSLRSAHSISVFGPEGEPVQADGDTIARLPVEIRAAAATVRIIRP